MNVDLICNEYLMVCKCHGYHQILALFDQNRITVNGVSRLYSMHNVCSRCGWRYRKVRDTEPEFDRLMALRKGSGHFRKSPSERETNGKENQ
jgi:hypothetical protein